MHVIPILMSTSTVRSCKCSLSLSSLNCPPPSKFCMLFPYTCHVSHVMARTEMVLLMFAKLPFIHVTPVVSGGSYTASHPRTFDHPNSSWWGTQFLRHLMMKCSPTSYFLPRKPKFTHQQHILAYTQPMQSTWHVRSSVQKFPAWHTKAAPNGKCCEGYTVPSMVRLMYQLKSVLK